MLISGIDDAGRGPVLGPMVLAGVLIDEKDEHKLKDIGSRDSKTLTPKRREELAKKIKKIIKSYHIVIIPASEIDHKLAHGINLNDIEALKAAEIIDKLNPEKVILDCPSNNKKAWKNKVYEHIKNKNIILICEHKADRDFITVSAASILAKVTRDEEVAKIQKMVPFPIGSGYPSDPITKKFMKEHLNEYENLFRKSWSTYQNHKEGKKQRNLGDF